MSFVIVIGTTIAILALVALLWLLNEYVLPCSDGLKGYAEIVNLTRKSWESITTFSKRLRAAHDELRAASDAFIAEANRRGLVEDDGRCVTYRLPPESDEARRYTVAMGPDQTRTRTYIVCVRI